MKQIKISDRVLLYYAQKYAERAYKPSRKRAKEINVPSICQTCKGACKASVELIVCPGKSKWG